MLRRIRNRWRSLICVAALCALAGCGNSVQIEGTQQLLASDAIDKSVAKIDFSTLKGQKVFFDSQYIKTIKGQGFVNADYIQSAIRQQLFADGCELVDSKDKAEYVVEARVGALGGNQHDVIYGIPENNALSTVATVLPNAPPIPSIPELSFARRSHLSASAKVAVFAYQKESGESVWQSGTSVAESDARNTWLFGAGPFQKGSIYKGTNLAGQRIKIPFVKQKDPYAGQLADFHKPRLYRHPALSGEKGIPDPETAIVKDEESDSGDSKEEVKPASHETPAEENAPQEEKPPADEDSGVGRATVSP
ncbi:MAG: hypothetical protein HUJ26_02695 [Planctomycetaceae bacterium]|nr:hypothetical protein [Planctomycetaceae bacterium]